MPNCLTHQKPTSISHGLLQLRDQDKRSHPHAQTQAIAKEQGPAPHLQQSFVTWLEAVT